MKRKVGLLSIAVLLTIGSFGWGSFNETALANSEIENKISGVEKERTETLAEKKKAEAELEKLEQEKKALLDDIKRIDHQVADTSQKVREKRTEIEEVKEAIEQLQEQIKVLEERIAERDELLKERARSMYQSGGSVNYLEVILGAKTFSDFLDRVSALSVIAQQDRNILDAHIADQLELEEAKAQVEIELENLEGHLVELEMLMAELEDKRQEKDSVMNKLEQKEGELHSDLDVLENADEILRAQEAALKKELADFKERQRQEAQKAASRSSSGGSSQVHSAPPVTDSGFMRPTTGSLTSTYGPRAFSGGNMHYGIDIGKNGRSGDVPIVAVQSGTVIRAYYSTSYGNTVMIAHQVNGKLVTTLYAHMENLEVSTGQSVSKGQRLGLMGNTGHSFGAHLHFEVHEGGWNGAKSNAVDPLRYIPR